MLVISRACGAPAAKAADGTPVAWPKPGRRPLRPLYRLRGAWLSGRFVLPRSDGRGIAGGRADMARGPPGAAGPPQRPWGGPGGSAREPHGKPPAGAAPNRGIPGDFEGPAANPHVAPPATPEDPVRVPPAKAACGHGGAAPASGGPGPEPSSVGAPPPGLSPAPRDAGPASERGRGGPVRGHGMPARREARAFPRLPFKSDLRQ